MKHKELIHNEDRFFYYRFYRLYSSTENKRTVTEHCSIQRLVTRFIFSKIATNSYGKYLHHKKQKRARVIPTKKTTFFQELRATLFSTRVYSSQYLDLGVRFKSGTTLVVCAPNARMII